MQIMSCISVSCFHNFRCSVFIFSHCVHIYQEWPLVREVSVSFTAPSLRPPDLPPQKPPRPNLMYRIIRRLKNYWYPPVEGKTKWLTVPTRITAEQSNPNSRTLFGLCLCSEPPKVEEPEEWKEQKLSTLELFVQTHNKNPVQRVSSEMIHFI